MREERPVMSQFDPYQNWLGIPPHEQPPNLYRLLGVALFECNPDVIIQSTDRQMFHVGTFQSEPYAELCQQILNELTLARATLLDPQQKAEYDHLLQESLAVRTERVVASPPPPPGTQFQQGSFGGPAYTGPGGYPASEGGPLPNVGGYPQEAGGYPANVGGYPQEAGGYPANVGGYPQEAGGYPANVGGYPQDAGAFPMAGAGQAPMPMYNQPPGGNMMQPPGFAPMAAMPMAGQAPGGMPMAASFPMASPLPAPAAMPVAAPLPVAAAPVRAQSMPAAAPAAVVPPPETPPEEPQLPVSLPSGLAVRRRIVKMKQKQAMSKEMVIGGVVLGVSALLVLIYLFVNAGDQSKHGWNSMVPDTSSTPTKSSTASVKKDASKPKHEDTKSKQTAKSKREPRQHFAPQQPPQARTRPDPPAARPEERIVRPTFREPPPIGNNTSPDSEVPVLPPLPEEMDSPPDGPIGIPPKTK